MPELASAAPSGEVLMQLLLLQSALHVAPDEERLVETLASGLALIPGVSGSAVCVDGRLLGSTLAPGRFTCPHLVAGSGDARCSADARCAGDDGGLVRLALRTARHCYGCAILSLSAPECFAGCRAAAQNTATLAALRLENERNAAALVRLGQGLEDQVRERTAHLEAERERLAITLRSIGDGVIATDEAGRVTLLNRVAEQLTGWQSAEAAGRPVGEVFRIVDEETRRPATGPVDRVVREGVTLGLVSHTALVARDGTERPIVDCAAPIRGADRRVRGAVLVFRSATEARRAEAHVLEAQKLESIGRLAGGVAHDFNNLLTVILSASETMKHDLADGVPIDVELVAEVVEAGKRARELTRQLLAFARRQIIAPVVLDLNALVRGTEKLLRRLLGEDIDLFVDLSPDLWNVRCDPGQIEQVVVNLAVNARDAMPRGGRLAIETRNVEVGEGLADPNPPMRAGPYVELSIRDAGQGMTPEVRARVFEPFFTTKPFGHGTGLGLATAYGIVKQNGGHILVESEVGQGTTFTIYLPRTSETAAVAGVPARSGPVLGTETVLVVEDDPSVRAAAVRSLRTAGYNVLVAGDGPQAIDLAVRTREPLHLLITDIVMPGLDGRAVAEALRRSHPEIHVLFVSGHAEEAMVERGALQRGVEFLAKPFTATSLLARVRSVLDAPRELPPAHPAAVEWSDALATGVRSIDMQHRELIDNANALHLAVRRGDPSKAVEVLRYLQAYVTEHFETEERYMEEAAYPGLADHRAAHRDFKAQFVRRKADYEATRLLVPVLLDLSNWLASWLKDHVLKEDALMARHLRGAGGRGGPSDAAAEPGGGERSR